MPAPIGHERPIEQLRRAVAGGRMHHAWILSGPAGVGRRLVALETAKLLLSDAEGRAEQAIEEGAHPDVHVITKELAALSDDPEIRRRKLTNLPLDVLRQFVIGGTTGSGRTHQGPAYLTSVKGEGKVFIIDEAELIDAAGQNALLKTLEEPPPRTWFFLLTTAPQRLLPTVHSRCQHIRFGSLSEQEMKQWMDRALPEVSAEDRRALQRFAGGSPGLALTALEAGLPEWSGRIEQILARAEAGHPGGELARTLIEFTESFAERRVKAQANASKDAANKESIGHLIQLLGERLRHELTACAQSGADPEGILDRIDLIRETESQLAANVNVKQALEGLALRWADRASSNGS